MKKLLSVLIILCLVSNITLAGEWVLKKNTPDRAVELAKFPGTIIGGVPYFYMGDFAEGLSSTTYNLFAYWMMYYGIANRQEDYMLTVFSGIGLIMLYNDKMFYHDRIRKRAELWNKSISNHDFYEIRNGYGQKSIVLLGSGIILTLMTIGNLENQDVDLIYSVAGFSMIVIGINYLLQIKRLDNAVFEDDVKTSGLIISPMIRPDMTGIMVVKRF